MSDPRFFENSGPFNLIEIANLVKGELSCNEINISISDISSLSFATKNDICFFIIVNDGKDYDAFLQYDKKNYPIVF
jgi:hypothetical protein